MDTALLVDKETNIVVGVIVAPSEDYKPWPGTYLVSAPGNVGDTWNGIASIRPEGVN